MTLQSQSGMRILTQTNERSENKVYKTESIEALSWHDNKKAHACYTNHCDSNQKKAYCYSEAWSEAKDSTCSDDDLTSGAHEIQRVNEDSD